MRYRLRTLLILLAMGPPLLAYTYWRYEHRPGYHLRQLKRMGNELRQVSSVFYQPPTKR